MKRFFYRYRWLLLGLAVVLCAYTGVTSLPYGANQILARGDVVAQVGSGHFVWKTNPGWASTDGTAITYNDFVTYVNSSGCATPTYGTNQLESQAAADSCKVTYTSHSVSIASGNSSDTWVCTTNQTTLTTSCSLSVPPNTVTVATLSSSTVAPTSSSTAVSISLTGLSYTAGCGGTPNLTVQLYNSAGTNVYTGTATASTFSYSYSNASATAGTYTWKVVVNDPATGGSCATFDGGADLSYNTTVNWTGTSASSYY